MIFILRNKHKKDILDSFGEKMRLHYITKKGFSSVSSIGEGKVLFMLGGKKLGTNKLSIAG